LDSKTHKLYANFFRSDLDKEEVGLRNREVVDRAEWSPLQRCFRKDKSKLKFTLGLRGARMR
jgi:hypothetical protein